MAKIHNKRYQRLLHCSFMYMYIYFLCCWSQVYVSSLHNIRDKKLKCPLDKITPNYIFVRRFPTIVVSFLYPRYPMGLRSRGRGTTSLSSTRIPILTVRSQCISLHRQVLIKAITLHKLPPPCLNQMGCMMKTVFEILVLNCA